MAKKKMETAQVDEPQDDLASDQADETAAKKSPKAKVKGDKGKFLVLVRHSNAPLKRLECSATDEDDAWEQYLEALSAKLGDDNDGKKALDVFKANEKTCQKTIRRMD